MNEELREFLREIGRKGGKASKRRLTSEEARKMAARSAKARKRNRRKIAK